MLAIVFNSESLEKYLIKILTLFIAFGYFLKIESLY